MISLIIDRLNRVHLFISSFLICGSNDKNIASSSFFNDSTYINSFRFVIVYGILSKNRSVSSELMVCHKNLFLSTKNSSVVFTYLQPLCVKQNYLLSLHGLLIRNI